MAAVSVVLAGDAAEAAQSATRAITAARCRLAGERPDLVRFTKQSWYQGKIQLSAMDSARTRADIEVIAPGGAGGAVLMFICCAIVFYFMFGYTYVPFAMVQYMMFFYLLAMIGIAWGLYQSVTTEPQKILDRVFAELRPASVLGPSTPSLVPAQPAAAASGDPAPTSAVLARTAGMDIPEQIKKLAELRDARILSDTEFEAKKAELLRRL